MNKQDFYDLLMYTLFALYGSVARTLAENRDKGIKGWALFWLMSANAIISGFCGFLSMPLSQVLHLEGPWRLFLAGMAGYMGLGFLAFAETFVKRRLTGGSDSAPSDPPG